MPGLRRQTPNAAASLGDFTAVNQTGDIIMWAGSKTGASVPSGYLVCDGSAVSRTTYAALFSVIGTSYGVGDGSTTFNLPTATGGQVPTAISYVANTRATTITSGGQSANHTHNGTSGGQSANHTHNGTSGSQSVSHTHTVSAGNTGNKSANHTHIVTYNPGEAGVADTNKDTATQSASHTHNFSFAYNVSSVTHTHNTTTGTGSVVHQHNTTTGTQSANHAHDFAALSVCFLIKT